MSDWSTFKLEEVSDFINGKAFYSDGYAEEGYRVIDLLNITKDGRFQLSRKDKYISKETYDKYPKVHLLKDDLLIIMTDITPDLILLGKTAIVPRDGYILNQRVGCIRIKDKFKEEISVKFLTNLINSDEVHYHFYKAAIGTAQYYFNTPDVKKCEISLPSLGVQSKITDIISSVDKVIELTEIEIEKLKNLKKGMMQDLLTKGIGHTKFKDSPIGKIPESWEIKTLKETTVFKQGTQVPGPDQKEVKGEGMVRFLRIVDYLSEKKPQPRYFIPPNKATYSSSEDLIMVRYGDAGRVVGGLEGVFANNLFSITPIDKSLTKNFLFHLLSSDIYQQKIQSLVTITTMPQLGHKDLYNLKVFIPKIEEQLKIATLLNKMDSNIIIKSELLEQYKNIKKGLMQDLLTGKVRVKV